MTLKESGSNLVELLPVLNEKYKKAVDLGISAIYLLKTLPGIINDMEVYQYINYETQSRDCIDKEDLMNKIKSLIIEIEKVNEESTI